MLNWGEAQPNSSQDAERELWRLMHQAWQNYRDESGWALQVDSIDVVSHYWFRQKTTFVDS